MYENLTNSSFANYKIIILLKLTPFFFFKFPNPEKYHRIQVHTGLDFTPQ